MPTKMIAWVLSFLSIFALWNPQAQPNNIPETRTSPYGDEMPPDKYGVWPTEEFTPGKKPLWLSQNLLKSALFIKGMLISGSQTESILVLHKGKLVYEQYFHGWDKDKPHPMYSVTKSILSALVGIAVGEGKIKGADQKVIDFFPDAKIAPGQEAKRDITIEHLLTMTSGFEDVWTEEDDPDAWWMAEDTGKAAFELPLANPPGKKYYYGYAGPHILASALRRAIGMDLLEYAQKKLFGPLGMTSITWETERDGSRVGATGISMTPRDMLRFGYLYLNYGRWEDKQIIPADWVAKAPPRSMSPKAYGYMFKNHNLEPLRGFYEASGADGQYIIIQPSRNMVIVRTGTKGPIDDFTNLIGYWLGLNERN